MKKKISVVIPTYRRPHLLEKCLEALARQNFIRDDLEIIVVSDGPDEPTRRTLNALQYFDHPFIQYIELPANRGPAAARNAGWQAGCGKLIAFTDDDCLPETGWLAELWKAYESIGLPQYLAFSGRLTVPISDEPTDFELNTSKLEKAEFITANCACTRRSLQLTGGFDERFKVPWREDSDLEFRLIESDVPIYKIAEAVVVHPVRHAAWGISIYEQRKTMFNALLYKKYPGLFRKKIQSSPAWHYYLIIAGFLIMLTGIATGQGLLITGGLVIYLLFTACFIYKRIRTTTRTRKHVMEMIFTSFVIPFASIYWTVYGAVKYRVLYY